MSKLRVLVFEPNQKSYVKEIENELKELQSIVGGLISFVNIGIDDLMLVCNDEGLLLGLPKDRGYHGTFFIVGDNIGESVSLTDEQIKEARKVFENKKNYESKSKYLNSFFQEKEIDYKMFNYDIAGASCSIDNISIINKLLSLQNNAVLKQIENKIRYIDFHNGDINHFLEYIGKFIAEKNLLF